LPVHRPVEVINVPYNIIGGPGIATAPPSIPATRPIITGLIHSLTLKDSLTLSHTLKLLTAATILNMAAEETALLNKSITPIPIYIYIILPFVSYICVLYF